MQGCEEIERIDHGSEQCAGSCKDRGTIFKESRCMESRVYHCV